MIQAKGNKYNLPRYEITPNSSCFGHKRETHAYVHKPSQWMRKVPIIRATNTTTPVMSLVILTLVQLVTAAPRDRELLLRAEREVLAREWAPIVWLHPHEHFYPSSVINFLQHINPSKPGGGNFLTISDGESQIFLPPLPGGRSSWDAYLLASYNTDCHHNCHLPKFLYGKKPGRNHPPPLYAVIHSCGFIKQKKSNAMNLYTTHQGFINDDSNSGHQSSLNSDFKRKQDIPSTMNGSQSDNLMNGSQSDNLMNGSQSDNLLNVTEPKIMFTSPMQTSTPTSPYYTKNDNHSNYFGNQVHALHSTNINMNENTSSTVNLSLIQSFLQSNETNFETVTSNSETALKTIILPKLQDTVKSEINNSQVTNNFTNDSEMLPVINLQNDEDARTQQNAIPNQRNDDSHKNHIKDQKRNALYNSNQLFTVTYWMFYPYNYGKDMCTVNLGFLGRILKLTIHGVCHGEKIPMGNHVGDWEHITIQFKGQTPTEMYVSSHNFGAYYVFDPHHHVFHYTSQDNRKGLPLSPKYPSILKLEGTRPILFAALGSHGLWPMSGIHTYNTFPLLEDKTGEGTAWNTWENLEIIDYGHHDAITPEQRHWLSYEGRWGNPSSNCHALMGGFCEINHGPTGIPRKRINFPCQR